MLFRSDEQCAGLPRVNELERLEVERSNVTVQVDRLPRYCAIPSDSINDALDDDVRRPAARRQSSVIRRNQSVRVIQQRDRGQNGQIFTEGTMQRRCSTPQQGVIHRRQVIEYERRSMDHFQRRCSIDESLRLRTSSLAHRHHQDTTHPLSRRGQRLPDRAGQRVRRTARSCDQFEPLIDQQSA